MKGAHLLCLIGLHRWVNKRRVVEYTLGGRWDVHQRYDECARCDKTRRWLEID